MFQTCQESQKASFLPSVQEEDNSFPLPPALPCPLVTMAGLILAIALLFRKDKASSGLLTQVHLPSLRKYAPTPPMTLHWRQTGYPLSSRCDNKHIHIHPQHLWLLWEVLLSCLVLEITDQFCKLRKHQKQSGGGKPNYPSSSKIRLRHAFAARGKIAS